MSCIEIDKARLEALSEDEKEELYVSCQPELWHVFFRPPNGDDVALTGDGSGTPFNV